MIAPGVVKVGTCNRCEGPAILRQQGSLIEVTCKCGETKIPAAFFWQAGRPR